ncbi:ABC transporter permease [Microbacterium sp. STN6]|uniref:ABC transporter permease n=1 Tax=Microbacterium sp. STN6 TaxID=2995588 RepID=UPI002260AEA9|nr:ABC transporter permease [Microbacterium sp. STN6]MCX7522332.1 ABC transporter permease [Microbacterium sp. STN6]
MTTTVTGAKAPTGPEPSAPASARRRRRRSSGGLARYIVIRAVLILPTIFILVSLVFFLMRSTGDPITAALGGRLTPDQLAVRIHAAGYDRPLLVQYFEYLGQIFTGNFGTTLSDNQPVTEILTHYGSATLELAFYSLIVAFIVGIPLGMVAAYFRDRGRDAALRVFAILCYATPVFFAGLLLKLIFSIWLDVLPVAGRASTGSELQMELLPHKTGIYLIDAFQTGSMAVVGDVLQHAVLPAVALGLLTAGVFLRLVRTNVIGTLSTDYVDAARSRGVGEFRLVRKHAYRPALIPIITVIGLQIALLLGGAVLTETTFEWKGLGFELAHYLQARDFVAVQGMVALLAVIVAVTNFVVDIIAALIDPRVRY